MNLRDTVVDLFAGLLLAACATACRQAPPPAAAPAKIKPTYDSSTGTLKELAADSDGDGVVDTWGYMDGTRVVRVEVDENGDRVVDRWEFHRAPAGPVGPVGQVPRAVELRRGGVESPDKTIERIERATRRDGVVSRWEYFENGFLVRVEEDKNGDGKIDKWETYSDGSLATMAIDTTHRGKPDRRLMYRPDGTSIGSRSTRPDRDYFSPSQSRPMSPAPAIQYRHARASRRAADRTMRRLEALLVGMGYQPVLINGAQQMAALRDPVSLCLIDLRQNGEALRSARAVRAQYPHSVVIGVADPARPSAAADAIRAGVFDVLPRPPSPRDLEALLANAREQASLASAQRPRAVQRAHGVRRRRHLAGDASRDGSRPACGARPLRHADLRRAGTGREMIARAIHLHGANRNAPFVKVDCSGPTPEDIELQLFGVLAKRPGTSGPVERRSLERIGRSSRLAEAAGGILFLENVTEMPARVQGRLVRVLRDREAFVERGA